MGFRFRGNKREGAHKGHPYDIKDGGKGLDSCFRQNDEMGAGMTGVVLGGRGESEEVGGGGDGV